MIVLLDADVLIDVALDRTPFVEAAAALLDALELRPGSAILAWHTVSNFYYLVAPARGRARARDFLVDLTRFAHMAPTTTESVRYAASLAVADFEDALQVAAAAASRADLIATRNTRDYVNSPIPAATPAVVLQRLREGESG
jgi:predicted nucleic acid-binding protein